MMRPLFLAASTAVSLVLAGNALGQTAGTTVPRPPSVPSAPDGPGDVGDLVSGVAGWIADQGLQAEIRRAMEARNPEIAAKLPWLGDQGLLLDVRVARGIVDPGLPAPLRLYSLSVRGVGSSPLDVMTISLASPGISPSVPSGYRASNELSYFAWIDAKGTVRTISHPFNEQLGRQAVERSANAVLVAALRRQGEMDRLRALDAAFATAIPNIEARASAQRLAAAARSSREALREIDGRLAAEIERERRAAAAMRWLNDLATGLSLADQLAGVAARLGADAPPSPVPITTETALKEYVRTLHVRVMQNRTTIEEQRVFIERKSDGEIQDFRSNLRSLNVPADMVP